MEENRFPHFEDLLKKNQEVMRLLWISRWKIIIINGLIIAIALFFLFFVIKPYYDSTVTILPDYGNKNDFPSSLGGLASLAGIGGLGTTDLPQIYENLTRSESVLYGVIYKIYKTEEFPDSVNLIEYFEIESRVAETPDLIEREKFVKMVEKFNKKLLTTDVDRITKILTVTIRTPESKLSAEIANTLVAELDYYVRVQRKSYASEQRLYIEKRLNQVHDTLTRSENELTAFREKNRSIAQSPQLILEQDRLARNVEIMQAIYLELTKQLEIIKIEEIKDTPILNIREYAQESVFKVGPRRLIILIVVTFFSALLSILFFMYQNMLKDIGQILKSKFIEIKNDAPAYPKE